MDNELGARIRALRKERGLSQERWRRHSRSRGRP